VIKVSELKTARQLHFPATKWNLTSFSLIVIQLCQNLPSFEALKYAVFLNNFFINVRLFKALKTIEIEACETIKSGCEYSVKLLRLRVAITKNKN
jgi:hypothetical protein